MWLSLHQNSGKGNLPTWQALHPTKRRPTIVFSKISGPFGNGNLGTFRKHIPRWGAQSCHQWAYGRRKLSKYKLHRYDKWQVCFLGSLSSHPWLGRLNGSLSSFYDDVLKRAPTFCGKLRATNDCGCHFGEDYARLLVLRGGDKWCRKRCQQAGRVSGYRTCVCVCVCVCVS